MRTTLRSVEDREVGWPQRGGFFLLAAFETNMAGPAFLPLGLTAPARLGLTYTVSPDWP